MRNRIGWKEVFEDDGLRYEINVTIARREVVWKRQARTHETWETFQPTPAHWQTLLEKLRAAYRRHHAPYEDLLLVERLAPPPPPGTP